MNVMRSGFIALVAFTALSGVAQAELSRRDISRAAHSLSDQSEHFHRVIHRLTGYSHLATDAHRLADSAEHFHQAVERGASGFHVARDFAQLQRQYQHLRMSYLRAHGVHHSRHVQYDWEHVAEAFSDLQRAMRGSHDHRHHH